MNQVGVRLLCVARVLAVAAVCCLACVGGARAIIYGSDDRLDLHEVTDPVLRRVADSVVMLTDDTALVQHEDGWDIDNSQTYFDWFFDTHGEPLCPDERFHDQPSQGWCSGFQVGPDLIATAGHCMENNDCAGTVFVFNYEMIDETTPVSHVPAGDVYHCEEIVAANNAWTNDWAIVRTDRPIVGHEPLPLQRIGAVEELPPGTELVVIGHPTGLPTKIAGGGEVRGPHPDYFQANVDVFRGNSGSAVLDGETGRVLGILVRGYEDFVRDDGQGCWRSAVCDEAVGCELPFGEGWEDVMRTLHYLSYVPPLLLDCGNGVCEGEESCWTCPGDCPGCVADTLFSDDFSAGLGLWAQTGPEGWVTGPIHTPYGYPPDGSGEPVASCSGCDPESRLEVVQSFDLTPFAAVELSFHRFVDSELAAGEHLTLWSWGGAGWEPELSWEGGSGSDDNHWHYVEVDLTRFSTLTDFRFAFSARADGNTEFVQIDDVRLVGYAPTEGPSGSVPEGPVVPGLPLLVAKGPGDEVELSWGDSCLPTDDDYEVYEGLLGAFTTHLGRVCSTSGATFLSLTPWNGNRYWLVVPRNLDVEGSPGIASDGLERAPGRRPCLPRQIGACP